MYAYNGSPSDAEYGAQPPALGITWLQSPVVASAGGIARYGDDWREGYRNLPVNSFAFYINFDAEYPGPTLMQPRGSREMYFNMQSLRYNGYPYVDPTTGKIASPPLSGDPLPAAANTPMSTSLVPIITLAIAEAIAASAAA